MNADEYHFDVKNGVNSISEAEIRNHSHFQDVVALEEGLQYPTSNHNDDNKDKISCLSLTPSRMKPDATATSRTTRSLFKTEATTESSTAFLHSHSMNNDSCHLSNPSTASSSSALTPRRGSSMRITAPTSVTANNVTPQQASCSSTPSKILTSSQAQSSSPPPLRRHRHRWALWMMRFMVVFIDLVVFVVFDDSLAMTTNRSTHQQHPPTLTLIHNHGTTSTPNVILMNSHDNHNMHALSHARSLASPEFRLLEKMIMEEEQSKNHSFLSLSSSSSTNGWWIMMIIVFIMVGMAIELGWKKIYSFKRRQ